MSTSPRIGWPVMAEPSAPEPLTLAERARRRRAAELLGDVLPAVTGDDKPEGWNEKDPTSRDEELLRDVPPHHG